MEKLVLILDKAVADGASIAQEVDALDGLSVTGFSRSLVDVEVSGPGAAELLRQYASQHGFDVEQVSTPGLIEPISPFRKMGRSRPPGSEENEG